MNFEYSYSVYGRIAPAILLFLISVFCLLVANATIAFAEESEITDSPEKTESNDAKQETRVQPDPEQVRQQALASEVPESELVWLDVTYPKRSESKQVLALQQEPRKPDAQGAILILPEKGQHGDWPGLVHQLRSHLPDSGWYTLSINLPFESEALAPERTQEVKQADAIELSEALKQKLAIPPKRVEEETQKGEETSQNEPVEQSEEAPASIETASEDNGENVDINLEEQREEAPPLSYDERAMEHMKAAMDHISTKGYRNIIIVAIGHSADLALQYIKPVAGEYRNRGFALIMIDAQLSPPFAADISSAFGEEFQAPILDLVNGADRNNLKSSKHRHTMAKASKTRLYQQLELAEINQNQPDKTLLKRIDSWLKVHAPGMAAKKLRQ